MSYKLGDDGKPIPANPEYVRMLQKNLRITIYFQNHTGIPEALRKMQELTGETPQAYIKRIVAEQLEYEGFYKPPNPMDK